MRLDWRYLFHKTTIWIVFGFLLVFLGSLVYSSNVLYGWTEMDMRRVEYGLMYQIESIQILKFVYLMLVIFIGILMNTESHRNLAKYIIVHQTMKLKIHIASTLFQWIIATVLLLFLITGLVAFEVVFTPYHVDSSEIIFISGWLYLQGVIYLALTNLLLIALPHLMVGLLPIILYWLMEMNTNQDVISSHILWSWMYRHIPNPLYEQDHWIVLGEWETYLIFLLISLLLGAFLQVRKDIL